MRSACLLLLLLLLLTACGDEPALIAVSPAKHDFGRVMQGEAREFSFTLTNHSDRTVGFKAVPNCPCFAVAHGLRRLDPGQSQQFHVLLDSTRITGLVQGKWITLHTDHRDMPQVVVPLEGEIFEAYTLTPPSFRLGDIDGRPANYQPRVIRVRPQSGYAIRLERAVPVPAVLACEVVPDASGGFDVHVSIPRDIRRPIGPFRARVRLELALTAPSGAEMKLSRHVDFGGAWRLKP